MAVYKGVIVLLLGLAVITMASYKTGGNGWPTCDGQTCFYDVQTKTQSCPPGCRCIINETTSAYRKGFCWN
uniref:Putative secreted peptide n=1 Tax=Rhipicephalus pulchellus TaxID=72859 RepID=L7MA58_RHIPC